MPLLNVKLIEGVFSADQKREMIERLTEAIVCIEGEDMRPVTWVVIEEVKSGAWGIGGKGLSAADGQPNRRPRHGGLDRATYAMAHVPRRGEVCHEEGRK